MTDNVFDINTRKKLERIETPEGETLKKFMSRWAAAIKDGKFTSVAIVVMDNERYCDWGISAPSDLERSILAHLLDDIKQEIKDDIFGYEDIEDEENPEA